MERIEINGLRLRAFHGVGEQERRVGNMFSVDVWLEADLEAAVTSDNVDDTINYAELIGLIKVEMARPSALLEHVAGRIRDAIVHRYGDLVKHGGVKVSKLTPPVTAQLDSVAVATCW
ncbi:MAG: dihydroneopterin aldolase [Clostridiales bacterium]|nr:dihydroneopterin aldolase [Clostridiales bacterium]